MTYWTRVPELWTDDNIVRRTMDAEYGSRGSAAWIYDEGGSVRGRCRACDPQQHGDEPQPHHRLCHRAEPSTR